MTVALDYDAIRADTVRHVAKLMAAAAITAPKSGGQLFLQGKHLFIETVIVDDHDTLRQLAGWLRARGKERREAIWFRDADVAEAIDAVLFVGLADWYPPNYDCGACGYATCAEFLHATRPCATTPPSSSSPGPPATCATSTWASPSARPPRPPPSTPSTAAAKPASQCRPQARRHPRRRRRRPLPVPDPQGRRLRPAHRPGRLRRPRPTRHRHPARRRRRRTPRRWRPQPPTTPHRDPAET